MIGVNEFLDLYIYVVFYGILIGCVVDLLGYGVFKAFDLLNIKRI